MKVSVAQLRPAALDVAANVAATVDAAARAASEGAGLVVLPELASSGYVLDADGLRAAAEPADGSGPALGAWRAAARRHRVAIVGGFPERAGEQLYNSVAVVGSDGELRGAYRKLHLFAGERDVFAPGDLGLRAFELDGLSVGVLVCYDLRFPEAARLLALEGAELIAAPTAWVTGFDRGATPDDERVGQVEGVLVQANLNQVHIACADACGELRGTRFLGRSLIASPYGEALAGPLSPDREELAGADVEADAVRAARERGPGISPRENRRTDVYALERARSTEPEALLREIERRRGYVLDIHRTLARLDPPFLAAYDAFLEATFLQDRLLDRRVKELVYVGVLIACNTPEEHLVTHMRAAVANGATEREVLEVVEQVLAPTGVTRFIGALAAFEKAFVHEPEESSA